MSGFYKDSDVFDCFEVIFGFNLLPRLLNSFYNYYESGLGNEVINLI